MNSERDASELVNSSKPTKLYKRRWIILILYILYAAINAFQWFEYSIITNIMMKFYDVSALAIDWTSVIYMALYMPMVIPASYLIDKNGLRWTALVGVLGTAIGTIIKVFSLVPDKIWVTYLGQFILSSMQVFILALPPRIAAVWFDPKEVSLACALGVFGTQFGQAVGFVLPPIAVRNHDSIEEIGNDLGLMVYVLSAFTAVVTFAIIASRPPLPPSETQYENKKVEFIGSLKRLFQDKGFNFHAVAYGINIAVFTSISTLLNQLILNYFPDGEKDAGRIGLVMVVLGMLGSMFFGWILDKTHKYKETTLGIYIASSAAVLAFMYALESGSKLFVYFAGALVGLFTNTYMPVGLEMGIELTYPEPETTTSGILISMTQTLGVVFTLLLGFLFGKIGSFWALANMVLFLVVGSLLTAMVPNVLKRQNAFKRDVEMLLVEQQHTSI